MYLFVKGEIKCKINWKNSLSKIFIKWSKV